MTAFLSRNPTTGLLEEILALSNSDAFGRLRVSSPETLFDVSHIYDKQPLYIDELLTSGGTTTHLPNESAIRMDVTTTVGSRVVRQTKRYFTYQPGKSLLVLMTGVLSTSANTSIRSRIGYFDDHGDKTAGTDSGGNGFFFEYSGGILKLGKRSYITGSQVDTVLTATSWSEGDPLDGTGLSGITFDPTKINIFWMDMEWLGAGTVRMGIVYNGSFITLHKWHHANLINSVYMTRGSLPVRYEIQQINGATAGSMKMVCAAVMSEGGYNDRGRIFSQPRVTTKTVNTTEVPLMSIRLKSGYVRGDLKILGADLMTTANQSLVYAITYGTTLTGAVWTSHNTTNSGVEYDVSATALTGGRIIDSGFLSTSGKQVQIPTSTFDSAATSIAGTPEIITISAFATGAAATYASLTWKEILV